MKTSRESALHTALRQAARWSLYGSLLLMALLSALLYPTVRGDIVLAIHDWQSEDFSDQPAVQLLQALIRIDTTAQTGSELEAARFLAGELRAMGLEPVLREMGQGRANVWALWEGDTDEIVVLHSHLDTDPIFLPDQWRHDPFAAVIEGPWLFGRGAFDMKSVTIAQLEALRAAIRNAGESGRPRPHRSVLFLATSSEESGSDLGTRWWLDEHPEMVAKLWGVLGEGGVVEALDIEQVKYWGTSVGQKRFVKIRLLAETEAQLESLRLFLLERSRLTPEVLLPEVEEFFRQYGPSRDHPVLRAGLTQPHLLFERPDLLEAQPPHVVAWLRNEAHPFPIIQQDDGFALPVVLHLLPVTDRDEALQRLLPPERIEHLTVEILDDPGDVSFSPTTHPLFRAIDDSLEARYGPISRGPYLLAFYANDCRFFRQKGVPCYGFSPFLVSVADPATITGPNEHITVVAFLEGTRLYGELLARLVGLVAIDEQLESGN